MKTGEHCLSYYTTNDYVKGETSSLQAWCSYAQTISVGKT